MAAISKLLIIEGKGKIKTIKKLLGSDYEVLATGGHIMDLANTGFQNAGVNPDGTLHKVLSTRGKQAISYIKNFIKSHHLETIYIATDLDREGEAIGYDVYQCLDKQAKAIAKRIGYTEITKQAINNAIANPIDFNQALINAQHCRQGFDKLLGFTMSKAVQIQGYGLSAGRVQSVALKIVKEREDAHHQYQPTIRYRLDVSIRDDQDQIASATQYDSFEPKKRQKIIYEQADQVVKISGPKLHCKMINELPIQFVQPPKPYITSTILIQAANQLKISTKQVSRYLQGLYEAGLITYPRTDSMTISANFIDSAKDYINTNYGKNYCRNEPVVRQNKASAQEGHECIRVVDLNLKNPQSINPDLDQISTYLYQMIWKNSLVQLMSDAQIQSYENCFVSENDLKFIVKNANLVFPGWKTIINDQQLKDRYWFKVNHFYDYEQNVCEFDATSRPALFSEASLIAYLEQKEIGRPSTYATYPTTIQERDYVYLNESKKLVTTNQGRQNLLALEQMFNNYVQEDYTAQLEKTLDAIANQANDYQQILVTTLATMNQITTHFPDPKTISKPNPLDRLKKSQKFCNQCQAHRLIKISKSGSKFLICRNWKWDPTTKQARGCEVEWL